MWCARPTGILYRALKLGEFCYVLNARQMGKSSLRVQIMQRLQSEGVACAAIDISEIGNRQHHPGTVVRWPDLRAGQQLRPGIAGQHS
jgi:hypothetical protein